MLFFLSQTVAQLISAGAIIYALRNHIVSANSTSALLQQPWFLILVAMQAIERLTGLASGVAFERDWVVLVRSLIYRFNLVFSEM